MKFYLAQITSAASICRVKWRRKSTCLAQKATCYDAHDAIYCNAPTHNIAQAMDLLLPQNINCIATYLPWGFCKAESIPLQCMLWKFCEVELHTQLTLHVQPWNLGEAGQSCALVASMALVRACECGALCRLCATPHASEVRMMSHMCYMPEGMPPWASSAWLWEMGSDPPEDPTGGERAACTIRATQQLQRHVQHKPSVANSIACLCWVLTWLSCTHAHTHARRERCSMECDPNAYCRCLLPARLHWQRRPSDHFGSALEATKPLFLLGLAGRQRFVAPHPQLGRQTAQVGPHWRM